MALLDLLRWRLRMLRLALTLKPIAGAEEGEGEGESKAGEGKEGAGGAGGSGEGEGSGGEGEGEGEGVTKDDDWQTKARKHERAAKAERKKREEAERRLKEKDDEDKTEQEKAVEKAREEGKTAAATEAEKDRRHDRLEAKCATIAARGIKLGEGDDEKTVKFADPDDAQVYIERAIREGDVDEDDIFDGEGKVNADALTDALADLLKSKPHLQAGDGKTPPGNADTRKGGTQGNSPDEVADEYLKNKYADTK
jgi:hypothetical protein